MFFRAKKKSAHRGPVRRFRPSLELLEDRLAPAIITVTGTGDTIAVDNEVTLREAIASANNNANVNADVVAVGAYGNDTIKFNIPVPLPINLTGTLTITDPVTIDGYTQPGATANSNDFGSPLNTELLIVLNNSGAVGDGIQIKTNDSTIKGLVIGGFGGAIKIVGNNNKVQGNFLGTNPAGDEKAANSAGVVIDSGSTGNLIGGVTPEDRNLISGNNLYGVQIWNGCNSNKVQGNYIGTDVNGTSALGNGHEGIQIRNASLNLIGGPEAEAPNLISGNTGDGVLIHENEEEEGYSLLNQIMHNRIGTNGPGDAPLPNGGHGVNIVGAALTIVGGGGASERNLISGNTLDGVRISGGAAANTNQVIGNYIGTDKVGTAPQNNPTALGNRNGVVVDGAGSNSIGGSGAGEGNVISGNKNDGVVIKDAVNVFVKGNFIGTDKGGLAAWRNNGNGVYILNSMEVRVGGTVAGDRNIISGNGDPTPPVSPNIGNGVLIVNGTSVRILNNYIGTDKDGENNIGNQRDGVSVNQGSGVIVGGAGMNEPNRISGNKKKAVSGDPLINKNILGKKQTGGALPNQEGGISLSGGGARVEDNEIWYNTGPGIAVVAGTGHRISRNSIAFNTGLGIDLGNDGRTINDLLDLDTGPNNLQNFPVLTSAVANGGTTISGTLNSTPNTAFTIEFFGNDVLSASQAQGECFLGNTTVTTNADGNATFTVTLNLAFGDYLTATATDPGGNTSEFSDAISIGGGGSFTPSLTISDVTQVEGNSGATSFVFTVTLSAASQLPVSVNFNTSDGSAATANNDYAATSGMVTFNPGETSKTVAVSVAGDMSYEPNENFFVNLTNASNATIADSQGQGTIQNDDMQPLLSIAFYSHAEGNSGTTLFTFTVSLSSASYQTVTVNYATADGSATVANSDYQAASGTLTFQPGETSKTITVSVNGDAMFEMNEFFYVNLSNAVNASIMMGQGMGSITNDD